MKKPIDLGHGVSLIDVYDLGVAQRTGTYVLHEEELTIIETSASPSIPYLLKGLEALGLEAKNIKNIIVTHIHLVLWELSIIYKKDNITNKPYRRGNVCF